MNAWTRATTANICHPAPAQRSRSALEVPWQPSHPRSPRVSNKTPRLVPSATAPTFIPPRPPTPHCRPPRFQYNGMSLPRALRRPARPPLRVSPGSPGTEFSLEPKLHRAGVQHRGVTEPLHSHPTFPSASTPRTAPGANPAPCALTQPGPSVSCPQAPLRAMKGAPKVPTRPGPPEGRHRPRRIRGLSWPSETPSPPSLYLALRLGLLPLQLGLEEAVGTRAS